MTCDVVRNRLLALPDPARPSDDLLSHLGGCAACVAAQTEAVRLDRLLKQLPVPSSADRKAAFLADLEADGPIIRTRPVLPSTLAESGAFKPVAKWLRRIDWRYVGGGVAAALVIGLGIYWLAPRGDGPQPPLAEKPRSVLLARMVKHNTELATVARTPQQRMVVYANMTADLKSEAFDVYKVAGRDEINSLAAQYADVVVQGVVGQAKKLDDKPLPPDVRSKALQEAIYTLAATQTDAARLAADAPPNARPALNRIAETAMEGRRTLANIAQGKVTKGS